jgi:protein SCO1/2
MSDSDHHKGKSRTRLYLIVPGLILAGVIGWLLLNLSQAGLFGRPSFHGTEVVVPEPAADFTLTGLGEQRVKLSDFRGQLVLLYFGYTYCPDICPATLAELALARRALGSDGSQVQVIMVSIDPERDTPGVLATYLKRFDPSFVGLSGPLDEIASVAISLGIFHEKHEGTVDTGYLVNHTGSVLAIDREGYLRLLYPPGTRGQDIAADLRHLLKEA